MTITNIVNGSVVASIPIVNYSFTLTFNYLLKRFQREGYMAWEYNPLRNFRSKFDVYETNEFGEIVNTQGNVITENLDGVGTVNLTHKILHNLVDNGKIHNSG